MLHVFYSRSDLTLRGRSCPCLGRKESLLESEWGLHEKELGIRQTTGVSGHAISNRSVYK